MAILLVCLSARGRANLHTTLFVLGVLAELLACLYVVSVVYSWVRHATMLHDLVISLFDDIYYNLIILGVFLLLVTVISLKLNRNLRLQPSNHSLGRTHWLWMTFIVAGWVAAALSISTMSRTARVVESELSTRLRHGLSRFLDNSDWQTAINRVQGRLQCCGVLGHTDWYSTTWIPINLLPSDPAHYSKVVQPNGRVLVPLVPSSCCRTFSNDCGHRAFLEPRGRSWADIRPADPHLLYTEGCAHAIAGALNLDMLLFKVLLWITFFIQLGSVVVSRYLYTSTINSLLLGKPDGIAPGWLFGSDIGVYKRKRKGKTLEEYDQACGSEAKLSKNIKKSKKKKYKGASDKETESDETQSTKTKRKYLKSPCLAKLRQKYKKKTKKPLSGSEPVTETEAQQESPKKSLVKNEELTERRDTTSIKKCYKNSPEVKKMLSGNLIDVVSEPQAPPMIDEPQHVAFEFDTQQISPFTRKTETETAKSTAVSNDVVFIKSPFSRTEDKLTRNNSGSRKYGRNASESEPDFNKTRSLFENAAKERNALPDNLKPYNAKYVGQRYPVNLIDLDYTEPSAKKETPNVISCPSSPESEDDAPVFFRNYMLSNV